MAPPLLPRGLSEVWQNPAHLTVCEREPCQLILFFKKQYLNLFFRFFFSFSPHSYFAVSPFLMSVGQDIGLQKLPEGRMSLWMTSGYWEGSCCRDRLCPTPLPSAVAPEAPPTWRTPAGRREQPPGAAGSSWSWGRFAGLDVPAERRPGASGCRAAESSLLLKRPRSTSLGRVPSVRGTRPSGLPFHSGLRRRRRDSPHISVPPGAAL